MLIASLWELLILVLLISIAICIFLFIKFIVRSLKRIEIIEKNVDEVLRILKESTKFK